MMDIREYNGITAPGCLKEERSIWHYLQTGIALRRAQNPEDGNILHAMDQKEAEQHRLFTLLYCIHLQTETNLN
jgi:hypothetical protein